MKDLPFRIHPIAKQFLCFLFLGVLLRSSARAEDWPTFRHDQRRSGATSEKLACERLALQWQWQSALPPSPAWPDSARWDAYAKLDGLRSMRDYDPVFHPIVVEDLLYWGSNSDDTLRCYSLRDGVTVWEFSAGGPIRVAPTVVGERLYLGADDGCVYALDRHAGDLLWKSRLKPDAGLFINDGRLCSRMPIRTGVLFDPKQQSVVCAAGIFPWNDAYLASLDADTGEVRWQADLGTGWTLEGPMILGDEHLISPQGRAPPQLFHRQTGKPAGGLSGGGGSFVLLTEDQQLLHGPGNKHGWITTSSASSRQKLASFENGTAVVVAGDVAYLLDPQGVSAMHRNGDGVIWQVQLPGFHELILAGDALFAGGDDVVVALDSETGAFRWGTPVRGRAMGLAVANEHLVVSTDKGQISVFSARKPGQTSSEDTSSLRQDIGYQAISSSALHTRESPATGAAKMPPSHQDPALLQHWLFHQNRTEPPTNTSADGIPSSLSLKAACSQGVIAPLPLDSTFVEVGDEHAWVLDGQKDAELAADFRDVEFPNESLSIVATVRVDESQSWGGLLSMAQDNGSYEKGWILGFRNQQFGFAVNGAGGPDHLTWTMAEPKFRKEQWYHLVGTYDGKRIRIYINGRLAGESSEQSGKIQYPESAAFHLAAYKDQDEHFLTKGRLNEIALYKRALSEAEIQTQFKTRQSALGSIFDLSTIATAPSQESRPGHRHHLQDSVGPRLQFVSPGTAVVRWWTPQAEESALELTHGKAEAKPLDGADPSGAHIWQISGVDRNEMIRFRLKQKLETGWDISQEYECDGHFDYTRPALAEVEDTAFLADVGYLVEQMELPTQRGMGMCFVGDRMKSLEAQLGHCLAFSSGHDMLLIQEDDDADTERQQAELLRRRVLGRPASILRWDDLERSPLNFVNFLIVLPDSPWHSATARKQTLMSRLKAGGVILAPNEFFTTSEEAEFGIQAERSITAQLGGTDWELAVWRARAELDGAAAWTHMYGLPDNTAFAGESLGGATSQDQLQVAWAGRPGPRYQSDRGNRKPSPLAAGGRLYLQGLHRLIGLDAHNGTILWSWEMPRVGRFNVPRDCSNWCADAESIYVACQDACLRLSGATGEIISQYPVWNPDDQKLDWGYVARYEDMLVGTGVRAGNAFTGYWGKEHWYDAQDGELAHKVSSDVLFALDADTGQVKWNYQSGLIVNPTISIRSGRIIFAECRSEELQNGASRRLGGEALWQNLWIVALDSTTGERLWETKAKPMPGVSAMYGVCSSDHFLLQTSSGGSFAVYALDASNGEMIWRGKYKWEADHHGKHLSRPAIVGGKIYLRPLTLDLASGSVLGDKFPVGHQCGTYTASTNALFLRAGNLTMWDGKSLAATRWERLRPDCWISTIPAEGMVLSPEGGGGCSCGGWLETSLGFSPRK